jgi:hypothetical protein
MIEVEGSINDQPITILIDSGDSHSYIDPNIFERIHFQISMHGKTWIVQLATRAKRRINDFVKDCRMDMKRDMYKGRFEYHSFGFIWFPNLYRLVGKTSHYPSFLQQRNHVFL